MCHITIYFSNINYDEEPVLILENAHDEQLGVLGNAKGVTCDIKYNENSTIEFELPAEVDGIPTPFYDDAVGMRIVELRNVGRFTLVNPQEHDDGVTRYKTCKGYSLEYEFAYKKITIPNGTYKFWDAVRPQDTVLGMILEEMPSWKIGTISDGIASKYRTFEVNNENVYNFMKGTVQKAYGCIFIFDTFNRTINVRDAADNPRSTAVYLSTGNLAKEIEVTENTEDIVTRLDVNGAEGISIRDVNPTGTNRIIDLSYYMTPDNFPQALIDKYNAWVARCESYRQGYYALSIRYSLATMQKATESAKLADLMGEMTSLENLQAVAIQAIAEGLSTQAELDEANAKIAEKQREIDAKNAEINRIDADQKDLFGELTSIRDTCSFEKSFTADEYKMLDRYIRDGEVTESSFVATSIGTYTDEGYGNPADGMEITYAADSIESVSTSGGYTILDMRGGTFTAGKDLTSALVSAVIEYKADKTFIGTAYLNAGSLSGNAFPSGCVSLTGTYGSVTNAGNTVRLNIASGYLYFTLNASEYEKRSVAWDLYEYGSEVLHRLSRPTYTFNVNSANFLSIEEFLAFKNELTLGEHIYLELGEGNIIEPVLVGARFSYGDPTMLDLQFGNSFVAGESVLQLVELLEQSILMGKNVDSSKYVYSAFEDSGAATGIQDFMRSALDVAKNAILSSSEQAVSWDGSGLRLRRWANEAHTAYEPEQIWASNNSIVMTDDNWATAKMAIGKFHDDNLGDCWGIVAPMIVGTLLAGNSLIIESSKKDGGTSVFRVDGDGCRLFNSDFSIMNGDTQIMLNPDIGIAIGTYPLCTVDEQGHYTLDQDKANMWADDKGNLHLKGAITATQLSIVNGDVVSDIGDYIVNVVGKSETITDFGERLSVVEQRTTNDAIINTVTESEKYKSNIEGLSSRLSSAEQKITPDAIVSTVTRSETYRSDIGSKGRTWFQSTPPATPSVNDLWIDTTNGNNTPKRWDGNQWVAVTDKVASDAASGLSSLETRVSSAEQKITPDAIVSTVTRSETYASDVDARAKAAAKEAEDQAAAANQAAKEAAGLAGTKGKVWFQSYAPAGNSNDLWIDTSYGNNTPKRWDGIQWVAVTDKAATDAANAAAAANQAIAETNSNLSSLTSRVSEAEQKITPDAIVSTVTTSYAYTQAMAEKANASDLTSLSTTLTSLITQTDNGWRAEFHRIGLAGAQTGITSINENGVTVTHSNIGGYTQISADGLRVFDGSGTIVGGTYMINGSVASVASIIYNPALNTHFKAQVGSVQTQNGYTTGFGVFYDDVFGGVIGVSERKYYEDYGVWSIPGIALESGSSITLSTYHSATGITSDVYMGEEGILISSSGNLFLSNGRHSVELDELINGGGGELGGLKILTGTAQVQSNHSHPVDIPAGYFSSTPTIIATYSTYSTNDSGDWGSIKVSVKSTTGFIVWAGGNEPTTARDIDWVAIGY